MKNLVEIADNLSSRAWNRLERRPKYEVKTVPRQKPENVKEAIVQEREYKNIRTVSEDVAEFEYSPTACKKKYRMVVLRKNRSIEKGEQRLFDDIVYFFYITNKRDIAAEEIVWESNDRCNQENLIAQLKSGVHALETPLDNLESNWAYMVMTSLAWNLKAWFGLSLPEKGRWASKYKIEKRAVIEMELKTFVNAFIRVPAQIIRQGRKTIYCSRGILGSRFFFAASTSSRRVCNGSSPNFPVKSPYGSPGSVKLLVPPTCFWGGTRFEVPRFS